MAAIGRAYVGMVKTHRLDLKATVKTCRGYAILIASLVLANLGDRGMLEYDIVMYSNHRYPQNFRS